MTTISALRRRHPAAPKLDNRSYFLFLVASVAAYTFVATWGLFGTNQYAAFPDLFFDGNNNNNNHQHSTATSIANEHDAKPKLYVCFSTTLDAFARESDYDFLVPLTAQNWYTHGFTSIIMVVGSSVHRINRIRQLWNTLLPKGTIVIPVMVPPQHQVPVAQLIRHYAATVVMPQLHPEAYLRITDADMMILDRQPFLPPAPSIDIDIYNGNCCRAILYPMHSIGMQVRLWRDLLYDPNVMRPTTQGELVESIVSNIQRLVLNSTGFNNATQEITHGGEGWYLDQEFIRKAIDGAVHNKGLVLNLAEGPGPRRTHIGEQFQWNFTIDVHLTRFQLSSDIPWLETFMIESGAIGGLAKWGNYSTYRDNWIRYKMEQNFTQRRKQEQPGR